jgi:hypothetical protein
VNATDRTPRDQLVDLLVYAPIGLALEARELLPRLVERGKGQVVLAQLLGRVAAERGRAEMSEKITRIVPGTEATASPPSPPGDVRPLRSTEEIGPDEVATDPERSSGIDAVVPGYDALPAAEIVRELGDLDPSQLEVVRLHEQANRRRVTVLNKIDRLRQA